MATLFYRAIRCPLVEFLYSTIFMYPPAGSSIETVSDTVNRLYSTGFSCPWFIQDGLKSRRLLSPHWLSFFVSRVAPVRVRSFLLVLYQADSNPTMRMVGMVVTSVIVLDVPGNL